MGNLNERPSLGQSARTGKRHHKRRGSHPERPCPNPPSAPTGIQMTFRVREIKTHLEYSAKIKWDGVTTDEMGQKIPGQGVEIDHYEVQFWPTDNNGNAIETEDGHPRIRRKHKKSVKGVKVIDAEIVSGTIAVFTTKKAHGFVVGEIVRVQDVKPSAYNGKWTVLAAGLTATQFRADISATPAKLEDEGTVEGQPDPNYNVIFEHVSNPRRWYWVARVRAWDNKNCPSDWSNLEGPELPAQEAMPQPPSPTFVSLNFDRKGGNRHNPWRGKVKIAPVPFWDVPGGDQEDDMSRYRCKVQVSEDGGSTWDKHAMLFADDSDDEKDEDANILMVFHRIRRRNRYRVWLASKDRYNRWGQYTGPFPSASGVSVGGNPSTALNTTITSPVPRRVILDWDKPADPEDVDFYEIVWQRFTTSWVTMEVHKEQRATKDVYRLPKAHIPDQHRAQLTVVDEDGNRSTTITTSGILPGSDDIAGEEDPGTIKKHAGPNTPTGWYRCNGALIPTAGDGPLFAAIGYTYGGSGANFRLPDFRRRKPIGAGSDEGLGITETGTNDGTGTETGNTEHGKHGNQTHNLHGGHTGHGGHGGHGNHGGPGHHGRHGRHGQHAQFNIQFGGQHDHGGNTSSASSGPATGGNASPNDLTRVGHTHNISSTGSGHDHFVAAGAMAPSGSGTDEDHRWEAAGPGTVLDLVYPHGNHPDHGDHSDHGSHTEHFNFEHDFDSSRGHGQHTRPEDDDDVVRGHRKHPRLRVHFIIKR